MDTCAICLESIEEGAGTRHPGCTHAFHSLCLLNLMQYDVRCPTCRAQHPQLQARRQPTEIATITIPSTSFSNEERESLLDVLRSITSMPRESLTSNPVYRRMWRSNRHLRDLRERQREAERSMRAQQNALYRTFNIKQRTLWREDEEIAEIRRSYVRARDRAARMRRQIRQLLADNEEPPAMQALDELDA